VPDDLTARLERALRVQEEHEATAGADPAALSELAGRVARARRRRTARYAAVAAVTVAVVGAAGMLGLRDRPAPLPAHTPTSTPTSTPTPSATAAPEPSPEPSAPQLEPVSRPGMPPMYRAPEGLLEQTGPGWYLVTYASGLYEPVPGDGERAAVVVAAPTGELYHLLDRETRGLTIVHWPRADVARVMVESPLRAGSLDLRTGEVTVDERLPTGVMWVGTAGADEVWQAQDRTLFVLPPDGPARAIDATFTDGQVAPDGLTIVGGDDDGTAVAVDLRTGERTVLVQPAGQRCDLVGWFDGTGVLAACVDPQPLDQGHQKWFHDEHGGKVVRLDAAGGPPATLEVLDSTGVVPYRGTYVRDGVVAGIEAPFVSGSGDCYDVCYGGAHQWFEDGSRVPAPLPDTSDTVCRVQAGSGGLLLWTGGQCYEETTGGQWWAVDDATGTVRLVAPAVDSDLSIGAGRYIVERVTG